jgi:hypothetical protein
MRYGWRIRPGAPGRGYWTALIIPMFAVAVILLGMVWEVTHAETENDGAELLASLPHLSTGPAMATPDATPEAQLEASRKDAESLRQQLSDANLQLQQQSAALVSANEKMQTLEGEVASAAQKLAEAKSDRDEALRVAGKMWEDWRQLKQESKAVCAALAASTKSAARNQNSPTLDAACSDTKQE